MHSIEQPTGEPDRWVRVADASAVGDEAALEVVVESELVAVFRHQGQLYALEALCAHHGGPLAEGSLHEGCVTCPWHGWTYHLCDGTQAASGEQLIRAYPVREREGGIEIGLADPRTNSNDS